MGVEERPEEEKRRRSAPFRSEERRRSSGRSTARSARQSGGEADAEEEDDDDDEQEDGAQSAAEIGQQRRLSFQSDVTDQAEESTSEAHTHTATAAVPAAVLTLQAGNVRISYNPASSGGVSCSVVPRDGQRKPLRHRMHRARRQGGNTRASNNSAAGMPSDGTAASVPEEWRDADGAAAAELSAGSVHVLRAPGCTLRLHT